VTLPTERKNVELPSEKIVFVITTGEWATLRKALGIGVRKRSDDGYKRMKITSDGATVRMAVACGYAKPSADEYWLNVNAETHGHECNMYFDPSNLPMIAGSYEICVTPHYTQFKTKSGYNALYLVGPEPQLSNWGGKMIYRLKVTKGMMQDCYVFVDAHSVQEAEALVRQRADDEFQWTGEPRLHREYSVV
jgi:hypothetical protein